MTAELTAEVYGRYTKNRKWKKKRTNNYRKSDKTVSRTFDSTTHLLYYAFTLVTV